jgi:hypothetical protein
MDSHATDIGAPEGNFLKNMPTTGPAVIPFGIMVPSGLPDMLVPLAVSTDAGAYSSLRMDPVRMNMGEAASVAISVVNEFNLGKYGKKISLHDLLSEEYYPLFLYVQKKLIEQHNGAIYVYADSKDSGSWDVWSKTAIQFSSIWGLSHDYDVNKSFSFKQDEPITRQEFMELILLAATKSLTISSEHNSNFSEEWAKLSIEDSEEWMNLSIKDAFENFISKVVDRETDADPVFNYSDIDDEYNISKEYSDYITIKNRYKPYIAFATGKGIVKGYKDKNFGPKDPLLRSESAKILVNVYALVNGKEIDDFAISSTVEGRCLKDMDKTPFSDDVNDKSKWYFHYISCAKELGLMRGKDTNKFDPDGKTTRAEAAMMGCRFYLDGLATSIEYQNKDNETAKIGHTSQMKYLEDKGIETLAKLCDMQK